MWPIVLITLAGAALIGFLGLESARNARARQSSNRQTAGKVISMIEDRINSGNAADRNKGNPEAMRLAEGGGVDNRLQAANIRR